MVSECIPLENKTKKPPTERGIACLVINPGTLYATQETGALKKNQGSFIYFYKRVVLTGA